MDKSPKTATTEHCLNYGSKFKRELIKSRFGKTSYNKFIKYVLDIKGNALSGQPYFRRT